MEIVFGEKRNCFVNVESDPSWLQYGKLNFKKKESCDTEKIYVMQGPNFTQKNMTATIYE